MPRINKKHDDDFDSSSRRPLIDEELKELLMDIRRAGGGRWFGYQFIKFLEKIGVVSHVKIRDSGSIESYSLVHDVIGHFKGKETIPGTGIVYESEVPYDDWSVIRDQIEKYLYRREQAEKRDKESKLNLYEEEISKEKESNTTG